MAYKCTECSFEIFVPVVVGADSVVGLYDDDRFEGRCIVSLREHAAHLDELTANASQALLRDATAVGRALRLLRLAQRVNYAVLGNVHPHVHMHVIPRGSKLDVVPQRPPWEHPRKGKRLPARRRVEIVDDLRGALLPLGRFELPSDCD